MRFFDGLYPHEIILLALGVILFLVLTFAFVLLLVRGKPYAKLFIFFALPIVMIGFPGVKSFEISADVIKLEKEARALEENPTDNKLRASLEQTVAKVSARPVNAPQVSTAIARAQLALGNENAAEARVENALKEDPKLPSAVELKKRIDLDRKLAALASQVEQNPGNAAAKTELKITVKEVDRMQIANPKTITNIAHAQKLLGDRAKAQANLDKALTINPNLAQAIQLKRKLQINPVPAAPRSP